MTVLSSEKRAPSRPTGRVLEQRARVLGVESVRFVERVLTKCGLRGEDLCDLRQEVLLAAHRALDGFRGDASLETWLYRICVREVRHHQRKRSRAELLILPHDISSVAASQLRDVLAREDERRLARALTRLGEAKRLALELYVLEELSMKEVAAQLGCPVQTAYSRVQAARDEVALILEHGEAPAP